MKEKKKLKEVDELKNVFVNDFLTKESLELLKYAKSLKAVGYKFIYTQSGKIIARKDEKSRQVFLKNMDDIDQLLMKSSANVPLRTNGASKGDHDDGDDDEQEEDEDDDNGCYLSPN